jgi:Domain of unknown function (DUF4279)
MRTVTPYDDDYPTCIKTFVWLRVMSVTLDPNAVTAAIGVEPTRVQFKGTVSIGAALKRPARFSGWFLESSEHIISRDTRRHIDWLLSRLRGKEDVLAELQTRGHLVDICCRWYSIGHGGPTLNSEHLRQLGELGVEVWFEVYFAGQDSDA